MAQTAQELVPLETAWLSTSRSPAAVLGNIVLLAMGTQDQGEELWRTDGTAQGTYLLKDIVPGPSSSAPGQFVNHDGLVYFCAYDAVHGQELWRTDGTVEGTELVVDATPGPEGEVSLIIPGTGGIYFGSTNLYWTDGTASGTLLLTPDPVQVFGNDRINRNAIMIGDTLFFVGSTASYHQELWRSDGTVAGTYMIKDIEPGIWPGVLIPGKFNELRESLYFQAFSTAEPSAGLWRSDGTSAGTLPVFGPESGMDQNSVWGIVPFGEFLLFAVSTPTSGYELWQSDGTPIGTGMLAELGPGGTSGLLGGKIFVSGTQVFLHATIGSNGPGQELYRYMNGQIEFVKDIRQGPEDAYIDNGLEACGGLFFTAGDGENGLELWFSDGTGPGTNMVADMIPGPDGWAIPWISLNNMVFFAEYNADEIGTLCVVNCSTVGVVEEQGRDPLAIHPNPASNTARLTLPTGVSDWQVTIHDAVGRLLFTDRISGTSTTLDLSGWSSGVYQVVAQQQQTRSVGRLIVQ